MMEIKDLRDKERGELLKLLKEARLEMVRLKMERKTGSLADGSTIHKKQKEIAQTTTVLREKEILAEATVEKEAPLGKLKEEKDAKTKT